METLTLPNGTQIQVPEGLSEEEKQNIIGNINNYNTNTQLPSTGLDDVAEGGLLSDVPEALKNNWVYDNVVVAPYEGTRKALNSASSLIEDLGDTLGEKTNFGGFRYGSKAENGLVEYVPYDQAVEEGDVSGILAPITGKVGAKDHFHIKGFFYDPTKDNPEDNTQGMTASFVESLFQFGIGFKGADKLLRLGKATTATGQATQAIAKGSVGDFIAFDEDTGRFTDVVTEYFPSVGDSWLGYLQSDEDDEWYEARFKNALEGAGLGAITEFTFRFGKYLNNKAKGKLSEAQAKKDVETINKAQDAIRNSKDKLDEATSVSEKMKIVNDALSNVEGFKKPRRTSSATKIQILNKLAKDDLNINYKKWKSGELTSEEAFALPRSWINLDTFDKEGVSRDFIKTITAMYDTLQSTYKTVNRDFSEEAIKKKAIDNYGGDINKIYKEFQELGISIEDTAPLIYAHEIALNSLIDALPSLRRQAQQGLRPQKDVDDALAYILTMQKNRSGVASNTGGNLFTFSIAKKDIQQKRQIIQENLESAINELNNFGKDKTGQITKQAKAKFLDRVATLDNPQVTRKVIGALFQNRFWEIANEVWINALLSNPKTQIVNAIGNAITAVAKPLEDKMGGQISAYLAKNDVEKLKVFQRQAEEAEITFAGLAQYLSDANKMRKKAWQTGELVLEQQGFGTKLDTATNKAVGGKVGEIIRLPSKALNAGDEFFKQINYRSKLRSLAVSKAKELNLKGKERTKYIDDYFNDGFDEVGRGTNLEALNYAREATYTNELTGVMLKLQNFINEYPVLKQFFPFVRTPVQLAKAVIDRSPFALGYRWRHILGRSNDPRMMVKARGQLAMGGVLFSSAYLLGQAGAMSSATNHNAGWFQEGDEKMLNKFRDAELIRTKKSLTNFKPYSFIIGDTQIPFGRLDPYGAFFGIVADIQSNYNRLKQEELEELGATAQLFLLNQADNDPLSVGDKMVMGTRATLSAVRDNVLSKTYLQSLHDIVDAVFANDERTVQRYFINKLGSYYPNIFNKLANDPYLRHAYNIIDEAKKRTGLGTPVSPRYNFLGEAHKNPEGDIERFLNSFLLPVTVSKKKKDILASEILRLGKAPKPIDRFYKGLNLEDYKRGKVNARDRYNTLLSTVKIEGLTLRQKLEQVIQSDDYKDLSEPVKINQGVSDGGGKFERINYFYNRYKDEAELLLKNEMKDFKYTKDDRRTLKRDVRLQDENIKAIGQSNRTDETLKEKLKDLNNFSNQIN